MMKTLANSGQTARASDTGIDRIVYTPAQFAALFDRSETWGYRQLYAGKVKRLKGSATILIPKAEVERFLSQTTRHV